MQFKFEQKEKKNNEKLLFKPIFSHKKVFQKKPKRVLSLPTFKVVFYTYFPQNRIQYHISLQHN